MDLKEEVEHLTDILKRVKTANIDESHFYDTLKILRDEMQRMKLKDEVSHGSYYWNLETTLNDQADAYTHLKSKSKKQNLSLYDDFIKNFKWDIEKELTNKEYLLRGNN